MVSWRPWYVRGPVRGSPERDRPPCDGCGGSPESSAPYERKQAGSGFRRRPARFATAPARKRGRLGLRAHAVDIAIAGIASHAAEPDVFLLDCGHLVLRQGALRRLDVDTVEPRRVAGKDRGLGRAVRRAERREAILLLHVRGNLQSAERLDLPLGRAIPERIGAPYHVVDPEPADQAAHERRGEARVGDGGIGEGRANLAVDVADPVLGRDLGEVRGPLDAARLLEFGERVVGLLHERPEGSMIDDEIDLRPVLGGLPDVPDRVVLPHSGPRLLVVGGEEALVDADGGDAGLADLLVEWVHQLFVVEPPVGLLLGGEQRIADRVALPRVGLDGGDAAVHLVYPAGPLGRDDRVSEETT